MIATARMPTDERPRERLRVYIGPRRKRRQGGYYPRWPYRFRLPGGPWVCGTGAFTEAATRQLVDGMIQDALVSARMSERGFAESSRDPIQKHVADYLRWGKMQGGKGGLPWSTDHHDHRRAQLRGWISALNLNLLSDIRPDGFAAANTERLERGMAPNTVNHHAWSLVAFLNWCKDRKRIAHNCLEGFSSLDRRPRRERGAFTAQEFRSLLEAAPEHRRLVYRMAAFTGLRRSALASLKIGSMDWEAGLVTLDWTAAKNRKTTVKPVPQRLLADLRIARAGGTAEDPLLDFSPRHAARNIHRDMLRAGIPVVSGGRRRDFHSLKASLGTLLDGFGAPPEITQKALDHASFRQTQAYIKRDVAPLRAVVEDLETRLFPGGAFHTRDAEAGGELCLLGFGGGVRVPHPLRLI